jgi:hypothetical protein
MIVPRRPHELMDAQIEASEKALETILSHNPQFGREFLNTMIQLVEWKHVLAVLKVADDSENKNVTDFARLEGQVELSNYLAELRDNIKEEMKDG